MTANGTGPRIRKPNRVSRPVHATQRGTSTTYPHPDHRRMATQRSRYTGYTLREIVQVTP